MRPNICIWTILMVARHVLGDCNNDAKFGLTFPGNHNPAEPPGVIGTQTNVHVAITLTSIVEVDDRLNKLRAIMKMSTVWADPNISMEPDITFLDKTEDVLDCIFTPEIWFFGQQKVQSQSALLSKRSVFVNRASNNSLGGIVIDAWRHFLIDLHCGNFEFDAFPMDTQTCDLILHGQPASEYQGKLSALSLNLTGSFDVDHKLDFEALHVQYDIEMVDLTKDKINDLVERNFKSFIAKRLIMRRRLSPYASYFISVELLVFASWTSYVVAYDSIPGRMSPLVTTTLALINILIKASGTIPDTKVLTAFEIWILVGLVQALIPLSEFAYVLLRLKIIKERAQMNKISEHEMSKMFAIAKRTDNFFLILSPILNLIFVVTYIIIFGAPLAYM